jgi:hypothetical protein
MGVIRQGTCIDYYRRHLTGRAAGCSLQRSAVGFQRGKLIAITESRSALESTPSTAEGRTAKPVVGIRVL